MNAPANTPALALPLIALILSIAGLVGFSGLRPVAKPRVPEKTQTPGIHFVDLSKSSIRFDQALLQDSAPLFLPTVWNTSTPPRNEFRSATAEISIHPPELHALGSRFFEDGPKLAFASQPLPVISSGLDTPFSTLGQANDRSMIPVENNSSGGVMVIKLVGLEESRQFPLPIELLGASKTGIWSPVEFFCTVENFTAMGSPSQTKFSGINGLDEALARFAKQQVSNISLPAGFYRITAFP